jgi:hypothetical protein
MESNNPDSIKNVLPFLVNTGKTERDNLKLNRFRLVLVTDKLDEIKATAESMFNTINKDDKVHLHVVDRNKVPIFFH